MGRAEGSPALRGSQGCLCGCLLPVCASSASHPSCLGALGSCSLSVCPMGKQADVYVCLCVGSVSVVVAPLPCGCSMLYFLVCMCALNDHTCGDAENRDMLLVCV